METRKRTPARSEDGGRDRRRDGSAGGARPPRGAARGGASAPRGRGRGGSPRDVAAPSPAARTPAPLSTTVKTSLPAKPAPWANVRAVPAAAPPTATAATGATSPAAVPPSPSTAAPVIAVPLPAPTAVAEHTSVSPALPVVIAVASTGRTDASASAEDQTAEVAGLCLGSFEANELPTARAPTAPSPSSPLVEKDLPLPTTGPTAPTHVVQDGNSQTAPPATTATTAATAAPAPSSPLSASNNGGAAALEGTVTQAGAVSPQPQAPDATATANGVGEQPATATTTTTTTTAAPGPAVRRPVENAWGKGAPPILQRYMEAQKKQAAVQQQRQPQQPASASATVAPLRHFDEVKLVWNVSFARAALRGLQNEGNTCFLNATVQCLLACPPFVGFLRHLRDRTFPCPAPTLAELVHFAAAFELEKKAGTALLPLAAKAHFAAVIKKLAGTPGRQEDAHEFLALLLDTLHEELRAGIKNRNRSGSGSSDSAKARPETDEWNEVGRKNKTSKLRTAEFEETAVTRIFGCKLRSCLRSRGAKQSITQELFNALPLDVSAPAIHSLDDALLGFMSAESLDWDVRASKEYKFERLPGVLIVHLKRFAFGATGGGKIAKHIDFPERLAIPSGLLGPHAGGSEKERRSYDLFGVVEHHGHTLLSGHYTAHIKRDQHWYHVDDTTINPTTVQAVLRRQAYLLFYQRAAH